jgi:hypothetical protein
MKISVRVDVEIKDRPSFLILERFGDDGLLIETSDEVAITMSLEELKQALWLIVNCEEDGCVDWLQQLQSQGQKQKFRF